MNRREFGLGVTATVVATVVPQLPETWKLDWYRDVWRSSHGNVMTETQRVDDDLYFKGVKLIWDKT